MTTSGHRGERLRYREVRRRTEGRGREKEADEGLFKLPVYLMHQTTCCAALVSPRIGNATVEMSHVFI